jgi:hypothetical protein
MGKTHTSVLRHFGYHRTKIKKRKGLFKETKNTRYFEHAKGYGVALRNNGAWRHCDSDGKRTEGKRPFHNADTLEKHLARFHGL